MKKFIVISIFLAMVTSVSAETTITIKNGNTTAICEAGHHRVQIIKYYDKYGNYTGKSVIEGKIVKMYDKYGNFISKSIIK